MRPPIYSSDGLAAELRRRTVATLPQLQDALGSPSRSTVFRLLKQLDYVSSYSHRGAYYALRKYARFDADGLWSHGPAHFSRHGILPTTVAALVTSSAAGWRPDELDHRLGVRTIDALRKLVRTGQLTRVSVSGRPLYCAADEARQQWQQAAREAAEASPPPPLPTTRQFPLAAACTLFSSLLNEKQRRLFAGLLSLLHGRGGDQRAAAWVGLHRKTVARGRRELTAGQVDKDRVRRPGGGRKPLENNPH